MEFGHSDFGALVETNASRWNEIKTDLSDWVVDKFVKRALGEIDDMVDRANSGTPDNSVEALQRARKRLDQFLDEWTARKARRVAGVNGELTGSLEDEDEDDD